MIAAAVAVMLLQAVVMLVDEFRFHRRRGLPRWERVGHPLDTASVFACYAVALTLQPTRAALTTYVVLAVVSCLFVTKDEFVHAERCEPVEHWLHALLFILHPLVLSSGALLWLGGHRGILLGQALATFAFGAYQAIYWNLVVPRSQLGRRNGPSEASGMSAIGARSE